MGKVLTINDEDRSDQIGVMATAWGPVTIDEYFKIGTAPSQLAAFVHIGNGVPNLSGDLVTEDSKGVVSVVQACPAGSIIPIAKCRRILTSGVVNGVTYTTDCERITWYGGVS